MQRAVLMVCVLSVAADELMLTRRAVLSPGRLELAWSPARDHVVLRIEAKTLGYFALSFGSVHAEHGVESQDAVLGWTDDGEVLLQDGVVGRDGRISSDRVNDYELLEGARNDSNFLSVTLQRRWSTCDQIEDFSLGGGSVLVSWALYPRPPDNLDTFPRLEDGEIQGSTVILFNTPSTPSPSSEGPIHVWPVLMPKVRLASNSTWLRWCAVFQAPEMRSRHWILGFRAEVRHPEVVKRMTLFECRSALDGSLAPGKAGTRCASSSPCYVPALVWTPNTQETIFGRDIGMPIGANHGGTDYYMLQVVYSLSDSTIDNGVDSSGLQVLLSSRRPRRQVALLEVGLQTSPLLALPPRQPSVSTRGWCLSTCLDKMLPRAGITLVSVLLHAQSAARKLILRHLQAQEELFPIVMELGYQADQQEYRILDPKIQVKPGDNLLLECQYNTQDRDRTTLGGIGSEDEICLAYIMYYPRTTLVSCMSQPSVRILDLLGIKPPDNLNDMVVSDKKSAFKEGLQFVDWGANNISRQIDKVQKELLQKTTTPFCVNAFGNKISNEGAPFVEFYQEQLVPMSKVTRCGVWDKALRHERHRNCGPILYCPILTYVIFVLISKMVL